MAISILCKYYNKSELAIITTFAQLFERSYKKVLCSFFSRKKLIYSQDTDSLDTLSAKI